MCGKSLGGMAARPLRSMQHSTGVRLVGMGLASSCHNCLLTLGSLIHAVYALQCRRKGLTNLVYYMPKLEWHP